MNPSTSHTSPSVEQITPINAEKAQRRGGAETRKAAADHDDILGDAYEFLMRHFAQDSGKSKGQFYTPSEVSRILAKVLGVGPDNTSAKTTAYDPTCGSGSLLLKVAAEAGKQITLEGQEKDVTTAGLARMNMILHDFPTADAEADAAHMNRFIEHEILKQPAQYLWVHRRFKTRPPGRIALLLTPSG